MIRSLLARLWRWPFYRAALYRLARDKAELEALANPDPGLWERARR